MRPIRFRAHVADDVIEGRPAETYQVVQLGWDDNGIVDAALYSPITQAGYILKAKWFALMQDTGLQDRNSKPIFEGDIVHSWIDKIARLVKWGEACWLLENISDKRQDIPSQPILRMRKYEVIGNIYENPELC